MSIISEFLARLSDLSEAYRLEIHSLFASGMSVSEVEEEMYKRVVADKNELDAGTFAALIKLKAESEKDLSGNFDKLMALVKDVIGEPLKPSEDDDVAKVVNGRIINAVIASGISSAINTSAFLASFVPAATISWGILGMYNLPMISAGMSVANDIFSAEHFLAFKPIMARYYLRKHTPIIPEPYRLADFTAAGKIDDLKYKQAMAENGLDSEWAEAYKLSSYTGLPIEVGLAVVRRGLLTEHNFRENMKYMRFHPNDIEHILALKDVIPPLNDLINMAVKEAFGDHSGEAQLPELHQWATKMGLTDYFTDAYWYAHWDRIALAQMYSNLYRGYWDKDRFMSMLRIKDVHPDDRDAIFNVAYQVPTIRELGYGYDTGKYNRDDIIRYRTWDGLSPEDAVKAADSLIDYRLEAEKEAVRREWLHLFAIGRIDEETFRKNLADIFAITSRTDLWVMRGQLEATRKSQPMEADTPHFYSKAEAEELLKAGVYNPEMYRNALRAKNYADVNIDEQLKLIDIQMTPKPVEVKPVELKGLTIDEYKIELKLKHLTDEQFVDVLVQRGYDSNSARSLMIETRIAIDKDEAPKALTITDYKNFFDAGVIDKEGLTKGYISVGYAEDNARQLAMWAAVSIRFGDLVSLYKNGWITSQAIYDELIELGLPNDRANELMMTVIKYQQPERVATEKDLTKAEIIKGWKGGVLDDGQAIGLLMDLGYSEDEAYYLLQINMVVAKADPESYWEMKKVTESYKKALGQKSKPVPDELLVWEQRYKQLKKELADLQAQKASDDEISKKVIQLADVEAEYRRMIMEWEKPAT